MQCFHPPVKLNIYSVVRFFNYPLILPLDSKYIFLLSQLTASTQPQPWKPFELWHNLSPACLKSPNQSSSLCEGVERWCRATDREGQKTMEDQRHEVPPPIILPFQICLFSAFQSCGFYVQQRPFTLPASATNIEWGGGQRKSQVVMGGSDKWGWDVSFCKLVY